MTTIVCTSDLISFVVPPPLVVPGIVAPIPLVGTALGWTINGQAVCLEGDELPPVLRVPQPYTRPPFVIPGTGTISVDLLPTNLSTLFQYLGKAALLVGSSFPAKFQVSSPAQQPTPTGPVPDPTAVTPFTASFIATNFGHLAS